MTTPPPSPEGDLIRIARLARGLSLADVATRVVEMFGGRFSASRLSQIETGNEKKGGLALEVQANAARLAHIAYVVGTSPEQLAEVDKQESAKILREIIRQYGRDAAYPGTAPASLTALPPVSALREIAEGENISPDDRRAIIALAEAMERKREEGDG